MCIIDYLVLSVEGANRLASVSRHRTIISTVCLSRGACEGTRVEALSL